MAVPREIAAGLLEVTGLTALVLCDLAYDHCHG